LGENGKTSELRKNGDAQTQACAEKLRVKGLLREKLRGAADLSEERINDEDKKSENRWAQRRYCPLLEQLSV
jgi:hypothetical protein